LLNRKHLTIQADAHNAMSGLDRKRARGAGTLITAKITLVDERRTIIGRTVIITRVNNDPTFIILAPDAKAKLGTSRIAITISDGVAKCKVLLIPIFQRLRGGQAVIQLKRPRTIGIERQLTVLPNLFAQRLADIPLNKRIIILMTVGTNLVIFQNIARDRTELIAFGVFRNRTAHIVPGNRYIVNNRDRQLTITTG